jgi:hypothetical protein
LLKDRKVSPAIDIWSFGIVCIEVSPNNHKHEKQTTKGEKKELKPKNEI